MRASAYVFGETAPGKALTMLAVEADLRAFGFKRQPTGTLGDTMEMRVLVTEQSTGATERYERDVAMTFPATARFDGDSWRGEIAEFRLGPGRYQARVAIRDTNSGQVGAVTHEFEVPALDGLRVTTPIVTDTIETPALTSQAAPKPVLVVRRSFPTGTVIYYQFSVLGAAQGGRVIASHEVRAADGSVVKRLEPRPIAPAADGSLSRLSGISMAAQAAGAYALVLNVTDEKAGRSIELHEPFTLIAPAGAGSVR
jgi:hypothetical protein